MSIRRNITTGLVTLSMLGVAIAPVGVWAQGAALKTYEVTITNITTSKQALSPPIIATHPASAHAWQMGQPASKGVELVAEEGMTDMLAGELRPVATDVQAAKAHLLPGDSITLKVMAKDGDVLSAATMLIQTNDGFTGLDSAPLAAGDTDTMAYDAGTEDNTEAKAHVPGPPFGGKNAGPATTPPSPISQHTGIKGTADVTPDFNWTGAVARFSIKMVDSSPPSGPTYDVTVTNITTSMQALSPPIIATHPATAHAWQMGQQASPGVELVAEEGKSDVLAGELKGVATHVVASKAHLFPGDSITLRITAKDGDVLSAATMLIQTNDGFTGLDSAPLVAGDKDTMAYDAGTEENTEAKADVPGPPFGGMMHGPDTTPHQAIAAHAGIKGTADVTPEFNWSGPVARFTITVVNAGTGTTQPTPVTVQPTPETPGVIPTPESNISPNMPKTGTGSDNLWLLLLGAGAALVSGLAVRRFAYGRR